MAKQTSNGVPSPLVRRLRTALAAVVVLGSIIWLFVVFGRSNEPTYGGKTLTEWLLNTNADWVWIPNDVYGHIHDELWYRVVEQDSETNLPGPTSWKVVPAPDDLTTAVRQIGTNGIPKLMQLMSLKPTPWAKLRGAITDRLPAKLGEFLYPYGSRNFVERQHVAAFDGFTILGTNAEPALPALSNLLFSAEVDLPLTWAIANIGPQGIALLTNALARQPPSWRNDAALALGLQYESAKSAVPALVNCVERGNAGYDVLGALGRIGCDDARLVPALMRLLEQRGSPTIASLSEGMAFLLLGLQRGKARVAAPLVIVDYRRLVDDTNAAADRRFHRRILVAIAPDLETQLPPRPPDEESEDWP